MKLQEFIDKWNGKWTKWNKVKAYQGECQDLMLSVCYNRLCQQELKVFKKVIKSVNIVILGLGRILEKTILILVVHNLQKLEKNLELYISMKVVQLGKVIMLDIQQFTDGLKKEYQNLNFALSVKLKKLFIYQIQGIHTKEIYVTGNGSVGVAIN